MADYGVNIKVGVQGQSNVKQLRDQIREIVSGLEAADRSFTKFSNNLKSFDQRRAQRKINEELDKTAKKYRELDRLQRQLLANDNSAIKAAEKRAKLEESISRNISAGRMRRRARFLRGDPEQYPSGANQPFAPDPMVAIRRRRDAEAKFAREIFDIEQDFARRHNNTQIELLTQRIRREMDLQEDLFQNALRLDKAYMADYDRRAKKAFEERGQQIRLTGQTSPIDGAVGIPGSPAALRAAERTQRLKSASGSALIGGAFPLLFGQGLGAAGGGLIGGFGGGMIGGEFGFGLSLVGTQIGAIIDGVVASTKELGQALDPLNGDFEKVSQAAGLASTETLKYIQQIEEEKGSKAALAAATSELALVIGRDGVDALIEFGDDTLELSRQFEIAMAQMQSAVAKFLNGLGITKAIAGVTARTNLVRAGLANEDDPELQRLKRERNAALVGGAGAVGGIATVGIDEKIVARVKQLREENSAEIKRQAQLAKESNETESRTAGILRDQRTIEQLGSSLLNDRVYALERSVIYQEAASAASKEGLSAQAEANIFAQRDIELLELKNARIREQENADKRAQKVRDKAGRLAEREEKKRQREAATRERRAMAFEEREAKAIQNKLVSFEKENRSLQDQENMVRARIGGYEEEMQYAIDLGRYQQEFGEEKGRQLADQAKGIRLLEEEARVAAESAAQLDQIYESIGASIKTGVVDSITAAVEGTQTLADVASNTLRNIANLLLDVGVNFALFGAPTGFGSGGGLLGGLFGRALGGPVSGNRPYMVGERGPELFVPGAQGNIVPNNAMGGANVVVNVDASGTQAQGDGRQAKQLGAAIGAAVQAELVKQKRPGGLLAS